MSRIRPLALRRSLDVADLLVFGGYLLPTTYFDLTRSTPVAAEQVEDMLQRVALLIMGLLHAATIMALPLVAPVPNSTRACPELPRWVVAILVLAGLAVGFLGLQALVGGIASSV